MESLSKEVLKEKYPDPEWQRRLISLLDLSAILTGCILRRGYTIPDDLTSPIHVATSMNLNRLVTRDKVPPKEARLLCLLTLLHQEPLVDIDRISIEDLLSAINTELLSRDILLPYVFGRSLYDKAAGVFPDEPRDVTHEETLELLEGMPIGVFQAGEYTTGPYGVIPAKHRRSLYPDRTVGLYHCAEVSCVNLHMATLSTDHNASVNVERERFNTFLERQGKPWDWAGFLQDISGVDSERWKDDLSSVLIFAIGDSLSLEEIQLLVDGLWKQDRDFRDSVDNDVFGLHCPADTTSLDEAHLMQALLQASDESIVRALDELIIRQEIRIPRGEIRGPVVNKGHTWGAFGLTCKISSSGVAFQATAMQIAPLRLARLISHLYPSHGEGGETDSDLLWLMRGVDGINLESRLDEYLNTLPPREVVERLVLSAHRTVVEACEELGIKPDWFDSDEDLVDCIVWKLGFSQMRPLGAHQSFWHAYEAHHNAGCSWGLNPPVSSSDLAM